MSSSDRNGHFDHDSYFDDGQTLNIRRYLDEDKFLNSLNIPEIQLVLCPVNVMLAICSK